MNPPSPPYYAVIFSSIRTDNIDSYDEWNDRLFGIVTTMDGYLGHESYRNEDKHGVTISYWRDLESLSKWRNDAIHKQGQELGRLKWYSHYRIRVCKVERDYEFNVKS